MRFASPKSMAEFLSETLRTPVAGEYDIIVAGAGPAGMGAAIAAGRLGAKVLLVEQAHAVGGIATTGLMSHWTGSTRGPLYDEMLRRAAVPGPEEDCSDTSRINPEKLKLVFLEMLEEAHVELRLYTFVSAPILDGHRVCGIVTESKNGRQAWRAKVVIDATGDGDVAAKAGAEYVLGRPGDHGMQPATIMFKVAGVDVESAAFPGSFETNFEVPEGPIQDLGRKYLKHPAGHVLLYRSTLPGVVTVNMTNLIGVDGTKAEDLTKAELVCRRQIDEIVGFLRGHVPGYSHCYVISTASLMGVRETRHFIGEKTITEEDIVEARVFGDWIATRCNFNFDIHNVTGSGLDANGAQKAFRSKGGYTIPYEALLPKGFDGILLAGRSISGTHKAHSNFRVMPICVNMGQGAATAAVTAIRDGVALRDVDIRKVQASLAKQGVQL